MILLIYIHTISKAIHRMSPDVTQKQIIFLPGICKCWMINAMLANTLFVCSNAESKIVLKIDIILGQKDQLFQ